MGAFWTQLSPPSATFTEQSVPDLTGKVYIQTFLLDLNPPSHRIPGRIVLINSPKAL